MIHKVIFQVLLGCAVFIHAHAWADTQSDCVFETSGVNVQRFKKSKHVAGFEELEKGAEYIGVLKGVGGFHLQLYSCAHYGASVTVLLGPDPTPQEVERVFNTLPNLLFAYADVAKVTSALKAIPLDMLSTSQHLEPLVEALGLTDFRVQMIQTDGVGFLVLSFYGG